MTTFSLGHLRSLFTAQLVILFSVAWLSPMHRAIGDTYQVTSNIYGDSSTTGSLAWAISQANANPGTDTINISSALEINIDNAADIPGENLWIARITESVIINGNGATLVGDPKYITSGGLIGTKTHILGNPYNPQIKGSDLLYTPSRSFAQIGFYGQDNSAIDVQINDLNADGLCSFVIANDGSTVSTNGGTFRNLVNYTGFASGRPVFEGRPDATLNLNGIKIEKDYPFTPPFDQHEWYSAFFGTIAGQNGNLNMQNSSIADSYGAGAINWIGGTANIVSSILKNSGGLSIIDDAKEGVLNFVNSILQMAGGDSLSQTNRIQAAHGGVANISSSTILYDAMGTSTSEGGAYDLNGMPLTATFGGIVNLNSSVVTPLNFDFQFPGKSPYLAVENGALYADSYSFVTPTIVQDSTSLKSLFHNDNIHTQGNTFELIDYGPFLGFHSLPFGAYPVAGGALVGIVPNAGNGGLNALINPIDNSEIRFDVFGNSRTFNGFRDIGAVQSVPEPSTLVIFLGSLGAFFIRKLRVVFTGAKRSQTLVA